MRKAANEGEIKLEGEVWRVVPNYAKYMVSSFGRVMSMRFKEPRILTPYVRSLSPTVQLRKSPKIQVSVASIVASAFSDRIKGVGSHLCHKDGCYTNSRVDNLEWRLEPQIRMGRRKNVPGQKIDREFKRVCLNQVYQGMVQRCYDPNSPAYKHYGGAGIRVCSEWYAGRGPEFREANREGKKRFIQWGMTISTPHRYRPGLDLSRIPDDTVDYGPDSCIFEPPKDNNRRKPGNRFITIKGETKCLNEWGEDRRAAVTTGAFAHRLDKGWEPWKALTTPGPVKNPALKVECWGELKSMKAWAKDGRSRVGETTINVRLREGWTAEAAITTPPSKGESKTAFGELKPLKRWAEDPRCVVSYDCLCKRLRKGWALELALTVLPYANERQPRAA